MADLSQQLKRPFDALSPSSSIDSGEATTNSALATGTSTAATSAAPTPSYQPGPAAPVQQANKKLKLRFGASVKDATGASGDKQELDRRRDAFL